MRRRIMVEGVPRWSENEPAYARRAGWGGSALGQFSGIVVTVAKKPRGTADPAAAAKHRRSA